MDSRLKRNISLFFKGWFGTVIIALLIASTVRSSLADWNDIPSGSMEPTILAGDRVFVNKLAYGLKIPFTTTHIVKWSNPERGDIVVFYSPEDGTRLIKRVIGLPGDKIAMQDNQLIINGRVLNYGIYESENSDQTTHQQDNSMLLNENLEGKKHMVKLLPSRESLSTFGPVTIPEDHYFMMGDNRDNSHDSRFFGFVDRELIVGNATAVAISRDGSFLHPRWSRFFKELI